MVCLPLHAENVIVYAPYETHTITNHNTINFKTRIK